MSLPLDDDGYLRRECPHCEQEFKWHHGPTDDRPDDAEDPPVYFCPLCGETALEDQWFTQAQVIHMRDHAIVLAEQEIAAAFGNAFKGNSLITYKPGSPQAETPASLTETNDMMIVTSPCHPWEPIKIPNAHDGDLHCLACGQTYIA